MVDAFHFNSQNTCKVYQLYLNVPKKSRVIPITHSGISDHRGEREFDNALIRLGFVGSEAPFKGLPILKSILSTLNNEGYKDRITLDVYGGRVGNDDSLSNVFYRGRFNSKMAEAVYSNMDLLLVPSICYETFSFVALEALSYGTPVMVSDKVGAKDLVIKYDPRFVFKTEVELYDMLRLIINDTSILKAFSERLTSIPWEMSIKRHSKSIIDFYKSI